MYRTYTVLYFMNFIAGFAAFAIGCIFVRREWPPAYKYLVVLSVVTYFIETLSLLWSSAAHRSNHWIYNLYLPLNCLGFLYFFYRASIHSGIRRINGWLLAAVPPGIVIAFTLRPGLSFLNTYAAIFYCFLLLLSCIGACVDLMLDKRYIRLGREPLFWLACGLLLDMAGSIVEYAFFSFGEKMILFTLFTVLTFSTNICLYLGTAGCFICLRLAPAGGTGISSGS